MSQRYIWSRLSEKMWLHWLSKMSLQNWGVQEMHRNDMWRRWRRWRWWVGGTNQNEFNNYQYIRLGSNYDRQWHQNRYVKKVLKSMILTKIYWRDSVAFKQLLITFATYLHCNIMFLSVMCIFSSCCRIPIGVESTNYIC